MGILSFTTVLPGQVGGFIGGNVPRRISMVTTDNLATVTTAGYLNNIVKESGNTIYPTDIIDAWYGYVNNNSPGTYDVFIPTISNGVITLALDTSGGNVLLPVVSGDVAIFNGTTGQIKDSGVSISGSSGTIPLVTLPTIANHIATYTNTTGTLGEDAATAINGGNIQAGLSGTAGFLSSFPGTATTGQLQLKAVANAGNFTNIISNASTAQAVTWSIQDPGVAATNLVQNAGQSLMKSVTAAANAGGSATTTITDAFCTAASTVIANWNTSANAVNIQKVTPGVGSFTVLSSGDPGASTLGYIIMK